MDATVIDDEDEDEYMPGQPIKQEMATDGGDFDQFDPGGVTVHETSPLSISARQSKVKVRDQIRRETLSEIIKVWSLEWYFSNLHGGARACRKMSAV